MKHKPIQLDQPLHERGEREELDRDTVHALAWDVAAALVARHPGRLRVVETHPAQINDCISLLDLPPRGPAAFVVHMNLDGHITTMHEGRMADLDNRFNWYEVLHAPDRADYVVKQIEGAIGLRRLGKSPGLSTRSIGPAVLARIAATAATGGERWTIRAGFGFDSDDEPFRRELFEHFPHLPVDVEERDGIPMSTRYWFVVHPSHGPVVAIDTTTGYAHVRYGSDVNLHAVFRRGRSNIDLVVAAALGRG